MGQSKYKEIAPFVTDNTIVQLQSPGVNSVLAYIDTTGKEIVRFDAKKYAGVVNPVGKKYPTLFTFLSSFVPFSDGLTPVHSDEKDKYGFVNKELKLIIPIGFKYACSFSEGLAVVQNNDGSWGYVNTSGKLVIPYDYSNRPSRFSSGLAKVLNSERRFGYINKVNKLVIPAKYETATHFYKGYALVREKYNSPALLIDSTGNIIATFPNDVSFINTEKPGAGISSGEQGEYPFYTSETLKQVVDEGKGIFEKGLRYGLIDNKGNIILGLKYIYLSEYNDGKMFAQRSQFINNLTQNEYGIINDKGEMIIKIAKPEF
jgi:hypothetical protein